HLPVLLRRGLVPHPDAALGADFRGQARRVVRGNRSQGLPSRSLSSRSTAAGGRRESSGRPTRPPSGILRLILTDRTSLHRTGCSVPTQHIVSTSPSPGVCR